MAFIIVSSEFDPMPAAAASRIKPWVDELVELGGNPLILTSSSIPQGVSSTIRSFFPTPSNNDFLPVRLFKEILLGFDLGIKLFCRRYEYDSCIITSPPFFMACICAFFAFVLKTQDFLRGNRCSPHLTHHYSSSKIGKFSCLFKRLASG